MFHLTYRPKDFDGIIGRTNKVVAKAIGQAISLGTLNHTLLFSGIRGVGKTTMARIIANMLGCSCENVNVFEINASDDRGIDKARSIISNAHYMPHVGDKKIFIIDEAHQITSAFSEAILKITEDTPKHVYFIFCSSKHEKMDDALISRCQSYQMEPCNSREITWLLNNVCNLEGTEISKKVINFIASNADGVPREALVSLHKVINLDEPSALVLLEQNAVEEDVFKNLVMALWKKKPWDTTRKLVKKCINSPEGTRYGVLSYVATCMLNAKKVDPQLMLIFDAFSQPFVTMGRDGYNGLIFACCACVDLK